MASIISRLLLGTLCCLSLNGCVLAVVGAAAAGGTLAVNSDKLGADDDAPKPAAAHTAYAPPASAYQAPQSEPIDEPPSQLTSPAEKSSAIQAQPLDAPTPLH